MNQPQEVTFQPTREPADLSALSLLAEALRLLFKTVWVWLPAAILLAILATVSQNFPLEGWQQGLLGWIFISSLLACVHHTMWRYRERGVPHLLESLGQGLVLVPKSLATLLCLHLPVLLVWVAVATRLQSELLIYLAIGVSAVTVVLWCRFLLAPAVCFFESGGPICCLRRSYSLSKGRLGRLILAWIGALVACGLLSLLFIPLAMFVGLLTAGFPPAQLFGYVLLLTAHAVTCCALPFHVQFVAYCRIREEELAF